MIEEVAYTILIVIGLQMLILVSIKTVEYLFSGD